MCVCVLVSVLNIFSVVCSPLLPAEGATGQTVTRRTKGEFNEAKLLI